MPVNALYSNQMHLVMSKETQRSVSAKDSRTYEYERLSLSGGSGLASWNLLRAALVVVAVAVAVVVLILVFFFGTNPFECGDGLGRIAPERPRPQQSETGPVVIVVVVAGALVSSSDAAAAQWKR